MERDPLYITGPFPGIEKATGAGTQPPVEMETDQKEESHQTGKTEEDQTPETGAGLQEDLEKGTGIDLHPDLEIRGQGKVKNYLTTKPPPIRQTPPQQNTK